MPPWIIESNNDWEEIKEKPMEKNWKITIIRIIANNLYASSTPEGKFYIGGQILSEADAIKQLKKLGAEIYSVKILDTGKNYKLGDTFRNQYGNKEVEKIESFEVINDDYVKVRMFHTLTKGSASRLLFHDAPIPNHKHIFDYPVSVIHTTEDGVDLYGGETVWYACKKYKQWGVKRVKENIVWKVNLFNQDLVLNINHRDHIINSVIAYKEEGLTGFKVFSTEKAANKYIGKCLFITEDGKRIFDIDKDEFYFVTFKDNNRPNRIGDLFTVCKRNPALIFRYEPEFDKYFSTKEKAEEYILYNKPCLSINDIAIVYVTANKKARLMNKGGKQVMDIPKQPKALLALVQQKLRQLSLF